MGLGPEYRALSSEPRYRPEDPRRWVTIWSRFPLREQVAVHETSRTVAGLYDTPLGSLRVYRTVLPWHSDRDSDGEANWAKHHRVISQQASKWVRLSDRFPDAALCVARDLNMNLGGSYFYGSKEGVQLLEETGP